MMSATHFKYRLAGHTLVELMVAIVIALFLMAGLVSLVMRTRNTSTTQTQIEQLQESERIALTVLTNVIQQAGYYPDPRSNSASALLPAGSIAAGSDSLSFAAGQVLAGATHAAAPGDVIVARFAAPQNDGTASSPGPIANTIINCAGSVNTDTANIHSYTNLFRVATAADGKTYLQCILKDGAAAPAPAVNLVPGLYQMQVFYLVNSGGAPTYVQDPSGINWNDVAAVKIRLYFELPQLGLSGGQPNSAATSAAVTNQKQYVERVISLMNPAGA